MSSVIVARRKKAPGVRQLVPIPGFGALARSRRDPLVFLLEARQRYGEVFRYQLGPWSSGAKLVGQIAQAYGK